MTRLQKTIKYLAIAFAIFLIISIIGGILGAVGLLGGVFSGDAVLEDAKTYPINTAIRDLDIHVNAADLYIKEGTAFSVESNLKHLKVEEKDGRLIIEETERFWGFYSNAMLTVYVPEGTVFDHVNLTTGAGRLTIEILSSGTLDFELGAGDVTIDTLVATKSADIEGGAGRMTISGGAIENLELDMGVGQLNLTSALTGNCQMNLGVGESNITLLGNKTDYKLELEKGIGNITIDGQNVSDYGSSGNGSRFVKISGGVGSINVSFQTPVSQ